MRAHRKLPPLNLCPNLFGEKANFAAYHADLFHAVAEASEHARGEQEVSLLKNIFTTIAASVCSILEVSAQINTYSTPCAKFSPP